MHPDTDQLSTFQEQVLPSRKIRFRLTNLHNLYCYKFGNCAFTCTFGLIGQTQASWSCCHLCRNFFFQVYINKLAQWRHSFVLYKAAYTSIHYTMTVTLEEYASANLSLSSTPEFTDLENWRLKVDEGRQTWHYLTTDEERKAWPQTIWDRYSLGLPIVCVDSTDVYMKRYWSCGW